MKTNKSFLLKIGVVLLMLLVGFAFYNQLPEQMPIHWNYLGQADNFGPKLRGLLMLPAINLLMVFMFDFIPRVASEEQRKRLSNKAWDMIQWSILLFMAYIHFVSIYMSMNPGANINQFMLVGLGLLFIIIGNYLGKVRQNYFVGIKVPWTFYSEEVWDKSNRLGGRMFVISGIIFVFTALLQIQGTAILRILVTNILLITLVPIVYSAYIFKKLEKNK